MSEKKSKVKESEGREETGADKFFLPLLCHSRLSQFPSQLTSTKIPIPEPIPDLNNGQNILMLPVLPS